MHAYSTYIPASCRLRLAVSDRIVATTYRALASTVVDCAVVKRKINVH